jgi:hypothetical protein
LEFDDSVDGAGDDFATLVESEAETAGAEAD